MPQNQCRVPSWSRWRAASSATTAMPHTGSVATTAGARSPASSSPYTTVGATPAPPAGRGRSATISARIDSATSRGVRAPMSRPAGVCTDVRWAGSRSRAATTASPRFRLATSPTYGTPARTAVVERRLLVASVRGDDHRGQSGVISSAAVVEAIIRKPDAVAQRHQRGGDRRLAHHGDEGIGDHRLEEDLERTSRQAGVHHRQGPVGVGLDRSPLRAGSAAAATGPSRAATGSGRARWTRRRRRRRTRRSSRRAAPPPRRRAWRTWAARRGPPGRARTAGAGAAGRRHAPRPRGSRRVVRPSGGAHCHQGAGETPEPSDDRAALTRSPCRCGPGGPAWPATPGPGSAACRRDGRRTARARRPRR